MIDEATLRTVANQALKEWDLDGSQIELVNHSENIVFRVVTASNEAYGLRMHRPGYHSLAELNAEQQWTEALDDVGIGVPIPKKARDGRGYAPVYIPGMDETRYVGMVEWIEGEPLHSVLEQTPAEEVIEYFRQTGRIAAQIHNQSTEWPIPAGFQRHAFDADGLMGERPFWGNFWDLPQLTKAERQRIQSARHAIHRILSDYGKEQGTYSLIHADLHSGNLLVNGNQIHVIDFDDSGFGWHQYELAVALFHHLDDPNLDALHEALLAGYQSERTLEDSAIDLIPLFILIRALALIGWTYARPELGRDERISGLIAFACERADALGL